ncbi:cell division protein ZipA C-terminal FtsZ-binding domain-containing protein [Gammaproteobacteria bacterium]|jgi:FtsZ-interacting cell division protein ZipA|nr:cell division protein ZipA C-terminal FtsZ-binding domain-containing protein [Gammaproteobacteria bacterium]MDB2581777.1 cell division protein ZipA C-terminal FtsZ-binding domain-containing protein [Gammaproteobacteria bacterium]MDB4244013.1 cell division protein ZipA C-terminal FtsZ-binding domain-containing protein [Gammaproteobacteria bacterium]MDC1190159.1 cell division protein ZipA C-terminal FtsZ-binding domain-containing protein [Gammaproteobacteria bacterium]
MQSNIDIYLIGLSVLFFLVVAFLFIRKISNAGELKVKIEPVTDDFVIDDSKSVQIKSQQSFNFDESSKQNDVEQELVILNLISVDKSNFDIEQIFGFMSNSKARLVHGFFSYKGDNKKDIFRIANALNPGTFDEDTKTFAVIIAADLNGVDRPLETVKEMVNFAFTFSEKFHANICDGERMPITKQMISHMESKAQEIARLKQLSTFS